MCNVLCIQKKKQSSTNEMLILCNVRGGYECFHLIILSSFLYVWYISWKKRGREAKRRHIITRETKRDKIVGARQHRPGSPALPASVDSRTYLTFSSNTRVCCIPSKYKCCRALRDAHSCKPSGEKMFLYTHTTIYSFVLHTAYEGRRAFGLISKNLLYKVYSELWAHKSPLEPRLSRSSTWQ